MRATAVVLLGIALTGRPGIACAQTAPGLALRDTAVLSAPRLSESSGLAPASRPGVYWSINDSGDGPFLYATDSGGADMGRVRVAGAANVDWEDLAAGPCPSTTPGRCLYIGDIGDNGGRRRAVTIYVVREPALPSGAADTLRTVRVLGAAFVRYQGGPRDAEGLAVRGPGQVLIATKPRAGAPLLVTADLRFDVSVLASPLATIPVPANPITGALVTGIALSPDQQLLAVRTYRHVYLFRIGAQTLQPASAALLIPVVESQGEAITFEGPGRLVLSSERGFRGHAILTRLAITGGRQ